VVVSPL
jgi:hypothetical protein